MLYHDPSTIYSPKDFIEKLEVIYDGGADSFALARIIWEGSECIGVRWNIARREWHNPDKIAERKICVGMPSSHGHPSWFILPDELIDRRQNDNLPSIESVRELLGDDDSSVIHVLVGPGQGIGAISTTRRTGLKEIRNFTKDATELLIIDPYIFSTSGKSVDVYLDEFKESSRINGNSLKRLHIIYSSSNTANAVKSGIKRLASDHNCNVSAFNTDKIHDRIWIKDKREAIMVGTSFGGVGNKLCFITRLEEGDLNDLFTFLQLEKMLTNTFI